MLAFGFCLSMSDSVEKARDAMKGRRDTDEAVDRRKIRLNAFIVTVGLNSSQPEKANLMKTRFFALRHFSVASHMPCVGPIFRGLCGGSMRGQQARECET